MERLLLFALAGVAAQLVDGTLGMGYGLTSTTLLVALGAAPALASASVHLAEVATTLASGVAHHRFGNVDRRIVLRLAVPGAIGAFTGAVLLSGVSTAVARPWTAGLLVLLGVYLVVRFARPRAARRALGRVRTRMLVPLGLVAGFVDATGGGGWGPVATPTLLMTGRIEPRRVVGSVSASEFLVAAGASAGFLIGLGSAGIEWRVVGALLAGGVIAAPVAALLTSRIRGELLGTVVGGAVVLTNLRHLLRAIGVTGSAVGSLHVAVATAIVAAALVARSRRDVAAVEPV